MSALEVVGISWVLLTSIAGHLVFATLAFVGTRSVIEYVRDLEARAQPKPEVVRRVSGG